MSFVCFLIEAFLTNCEITVLIIFVLKLFAVKTFVIFVKMNFYISYLVFALSRY